MHADGSGVEGYPTTIRRTHEGRAETLCRYGRDASRLLGQITSDPGAVTCRNCKRVLDSLTVRRNPWRGTGR